MVALSVVRKTGSTPCTTISCRKSARQRRENALTDKERTTQVGASGKRRNAMRRVILLLLLTNAAAWPLSAQRHHRKSPPTCSKGVQCGNTCIPAGRQCHVDDASSKERSDSTTSSVEPTPAPDSVSQADEGPTTASF